MQARKALGKTKDPYLIQQGINAFRYQDRQTDFRVNTQRGQEGNLRITVFTMRVGGNLSQGGRPADHHFVLAGSGFDIDEIERRIKDAATDTHLALEKYAEKMIGDLGIDLVIEDGSPFVIEANHKSGYPSTYIKKYPEIDKLYNLPSAYDLCAAMDKEHEDQIIEYARHLVANAKDEPIKSK